MFSLTLLALALPFVASAQQNHQVVVGNKDGATIFTPEAIFANAGDSVTFQFQQKNHSVVQSSFANPCGPADGGFNSGFMPVAPDQADNFPEYTIQVKDSKPIWVYCGQQVPVSHCHKGMVFAVNCGATGSANSFDGFKASAIAQGAADAPPPPAYGAPSAAPSSADSAPPSSVDSAPPSSITIPPAPEVSTVTAAVTVESSTWTTTYGSYPNSPAPTPASLQGNVIKVLVGDNSGLTFSPPFVKALPRDTIVFEFRSKNHTATQSTFADPCKKLNNATTSQVGFDSGFMPVAAGATEFPTWNITINDTSPAWVYCRQSIPLSHCGAGMVLAINSDESSPRSSSAFAALAKQINGTSNTAANTTGTPPASGTEPAASPSQSSGAGRSATFGIAGLITLVSGLMAVL